MIAWILVLAGGVWLLAIAGNKIIPYIKSIWPAAVPSVVTTTTTKIEDYADLTVGASACLTLATIARVRKDTALIAVAAEAWNMVMNFPTDPAAVPIPTPTISTTPPA